MTSFKSTLLLVAVMLSSCAAGGTTRPRGSVPARRRAGDHHVGQVDDPVVKVGAGNRASLEFAESARPTASRDCAQWGLRSPLSDSSAVSRSSWRPVFGPRRSCRGLGSGPAQSASDACPVGASTGVSPGVSPACPRRRTAFSRRRRRKPPRRTCPELGICASQVVELGGIEPPSIRP